MAIANRDPGDETDWTVADYIDAANGMPPYRSPEAEQLVRDADEMSTKLAAFDEHADRVIDDLIALLKWHRDYLIAVARGRHAWGHYRYGDTYMYEFDVRQLQAEQVEEIADAIVYGARRKALEAG